MPLQDPEERGDVRVEVVDHLRLGNETSAKEDATHADERLGVDLVGGSILATRRFARLRLPPI